MFFKTFPTLLLKVGVGCFVLFTFCLFTANSSHAQQSEKKVQAGWINQLVQYIRWRERDYKNVTICTLGLDSVGSYLQRSNKKNNVTIKVRPDEDEYSSCHFLYISDTEEAHIEEILLTVRKQPILTLSGIKGFARLGGMVQFVIEEGGTVGLLINKTSVDESKIIIDSDLRSIADFIK